MKDIVVTHHRNKWTRAARSWAAVLGLAACGLVGCGKPVPPEKTAYVGEWREKNMYLLITQDGQVRYKRQTGSTSTSVDGPLKGFEGENFEVGIGPMSTRFIVTEPPHEVGGRWKMVVDGVELTKSEE